MAKEPMITCAICGKPTVARQYIRIVPAFADEAFRDQGGFRLGDRLRFHLRHPPNIVRGWLRDAGAGIGDADSFKLTYNPPAQVSTEMISNFLAADDLEAGYVALRDSVFKWFRAVPREDMVRVCAAAACADDAALEEMVAIYEQKSEDELYERCLTHNALERPRVLAVDRIDEAAAQPATA